MFTVSPDDTVTSRLRYWSVTSPETLAFVYVTPDGQRFAYSRKQLFSLSCRTATWLQKRGVCKDDVILCLVPTSPEQTFLALGAALLGAVIACTLVCYRDGSDIWPLINLADVTTIIVDETDQQAISALKARIPNFSTGSVTSQQLPSLKTVVGCNRSHGAAELSFLEAIANEDETEPDDVSPDDRVVIFATSGSSGQSKLVPKTHRQVLSVGVCMCEAMDYQPSEVVLLSSSFGWITGYPGTYFVAGVTRVVPYVTHSPASDQEKFLWHVLNQERVTQASMIPLVLRKLLARADLRQSDVKWFARSISVGSSAVRKDVRQALGTLTSELRVVYGSTEMGCVTYKIYTDAAKVQDFNCGKAVKGHEVKVVDEDLRVVAPNTKGEVIIRNNGHFPGYLKQPGATAEATPEEGWFRPGDLAYIDDEGDLFVTGRRSDVIALGGFVLYPQLLESHLMECPGVYDVAVIPIPDNDFDNRPCVCVEQDPRPEAKPVVPGDILRACAEYFQGSFLRIDKRRESALPKVCLVFDKFPVNLNGKVSRKPLPALALERLGMENSS